MKVMTHVSLAYLYFYLDPDFSLQSEEGITV